jgi:hypothetical protein
VDLRCPGFGHHIAALLASPGKAQMCVGGSAALARARDAVIDGFTRSPLDVERTLPNIL